MAGGKNSKRTKKVSKAKKSRSRSRNSRVSSKKSSKSKRKRNTTNFGSRLQNRSNTSTFLQKFGIPCGKKPGKTTQQIQTERHIGHDSNLVKKPGYSDKRNSGKDKLGANFCSWVYFWSISFLSFVASPQV